MQPAAVTLKLGVSPNNKVSFISTDLHNYGTHSQLLILIYLLTLFSIIFNSSYLWEHLINNFNLVDSCSLHYMPLQQQKQVAPLEPNSLQIIHLPGH